MAKPNVKGAKSGTSGNMHYQENINKGTDSGMSNGSRNGRKGKNQVHEAGNTDNGNSGENMLNAGSLTSHTEIVREQMGSGKAKSGSIESHNTTAPEMGRP